MNNDLNNSPFKLGESRQSANKATLNIDTASKVPDDRGSQEFLNLKITSKVIPGVMSESFQGSMLAAEVSRNLENTSKAMSKEEASYLDGSITAKEKSLKKTPGKCIEEA